MLPGLATAHHAHSSRMNRIAVVKLTRDGGTPASSAIFSISSRTRLGGGPLPARSRRFPHVFRVACPKLAMKRLEAIGEESGPKQHHGLSAVL